MIVAARAEPARAAIFARAFPIRGRSGFPRPTPPPIPPKDPTPTGSRASGLSFSDGFQKKRSAPLDKLCRVRYNGINQIAYDIF